MIFYRDIPIRMYLFANFHLIIKQFLTYAPHMIFKLNNRIIINDARVNKKMVYTVTMEKDLEKKLDAIRMVNFKEYNLFVKKVEEIQKHALIMRNHRNKFNSFEKPLQDFKWIELNNKILVFTVDALKEKMHLCDYLPKEDVFE